jgi:demethylmenaquinone methyltransferase/2-methoxy-6-polyprenyl-1,4-benzoquinol methylase
MSDPKPIPPNPQAAWTDADLTSSPHAAGDKAVRVQRMFSAIADSYDLNNRVHSMGMDQGWRRAAVRLAEVCPGDTVLDVACGTGDLTLAFARTEAARVIGLDFTPDMLRIARRKRAPGTKVVPEYLSGDAMQLPLADASVDVVSIAFGIRNVANPAKAIHEFHRVLRPGGRLVVLEFSQPSNPILNSLYQLYFKQVMPRTASWIARDRSGAYKYLPKSVNTFIDRAAMLAMFADAGFVNNASRPLTCGIAVLYRGIKPVTHQPSARGAN